VFASLFLYSFLQAFQRFTLACWELRQAHTVVLLRHCFCTGKKLCF